MPYLSCCKNADKPKQCSDQTLLDYIYSNVLYPEEAKQQGIEGMVVVSFIITKEGNIDTSSIKIIRDIGGFCGLSATKTILRLAEELKWEPATMRGKAIDVQYNVPVRFKLN